ncbi:MAG: DsbC family protein [Burkholderiaceae bacterium]
MGGISGRRWARVLACASLSLTALAVVCAPRAAFSGEPSAVPAPLLAQFKAAAPAKPGAAASGSAGAGAADPAIATVRAAVEAWLDNKTRVDEVRATPVPGLYEVRVGLEFVYVDATGQYALIEGDLVDIKGKRNLTRERTDDLLAIDFNKDLPFDLAIKQVSGNGKRVIAVFEDPNCGYCRNLRGDLNRLKDATIYTFAIPILAADSELKARKALCAPDKAAAWNELMLSGKVPDNPGTCNAPMDKLIALGNKLNVTVTPTVFFPNGRRIRGYVPPREFEKLLEQNKG